MERQITKILQSNGVFNLYHINVGNATTELKAAFAENLTNLRRELEIAKASQEQLLIVDAYINNLQ